MVTNEEKLAHMRMYNQAKLDDLCTCGHPASAHYMNVNCDCAVYDGCKCKGFTTRGVEK